MRKGMVLGLFLIFAVFPVWGQGVNPEVASAMAVADSLSDLWDHQGAAAAYEKVLEMVPDYYEALWKAGDQYTEVADKLPEKAKDEKELFFEKAKNLLDKAIEVNPDGWEGHFRMSVVLGRLALFRGGKEKIRMSEEVKAEADKAIELNPEADLAYHVLGRWHQNLANLSGALKFFAKILFGGVPPGTNEEAVENFKKAIELDPNHIEHYLELARTYEFMKRWDLMKEPLETLLALPSVEEDDDKFKEEAREMLGKLNY